MKRIVATGRTVEEAVTSALVKLGVTRSQAQIKVLQEPTKGLFGLLGAKEAEVEVSVSLSPGELGRDFLAQVLRRMNVEARVKVLSISEGDGGQTLDVMCSEEDLPIIIGRHGATLDSLQYLVNIVANQDKSEEYVRLFVDAGGYRQRHKDSIYRMAERAAERAVRTRRSIALEPMSAADRKLVHTHLQEREDVTTTSEGVDPNRKVIVIPATQSGVGHSGRSRRVLS